MKYGNGYQSKIRTRGRRKALTLHAFFYLLITSSICVTEWNVDTSDFYSELQKYSNAHENITSNQFQQSCTWSTAALPTLFINLSFHSDILWGLLILCSTFHHFIFRYSIIETDTIFLRLAAPLLRGRHHEMEPRCKKLLPGFCYGRRREKKLKPSVRLQEGGVGEVHQETSALGHVHDMCVHQHSKDKSLLCGIQEKGQVQIPGKRESAARGFIPGQGSSRASNPVILFKWQFGCFSLRFNYNSRCLDV